MPAGWVAGAAAIGGALISANASGSAADSQAASAAQADATQRYMYDQTRADNATYLQNGQAASNKLAYLMGTGGTSSGANGGLNGNLVQTLPDGTPTYNANLYASNPTYKAAWDSAAQTQRDKYGSNFNPQSDPTQLNQQILAQMPSDYLSSQQAQANSDPAYGSLLKNFSATDLANDPIYQSTYQTALNQGNNATNQQASATGSLLSGNTLKALTRFGADTAATYGNDAYNRYTTNQTNEYNKLAGVSGAGQMASSTVGAAGTNAANNISQSQIGVGNARGASAISGANSINNALSTGVNSYQQQQYMNQLSNNYNSGYSGSAGSMAVQNPQYSGNPDSLAYA